MNKKISLIIIIALSVIALWFFNKPDLFINGHVEADNNKSPLVEKKSIQVTTIGTYDSVTNRSEEKSANPTVEVGGLAIPLHNVVPISEELKRSIINDLNKVFDGYSVALNEGKFNREVDINGHSYTMNAELEIDGFRRPEWVKRKNTGIHALVNIDGVQHLLLLPEVQELYLDRKSFKYDNKEALEKLTAFINKIDKKQVYTSVLYTLIGKDGQVVPNPEKNLPPYNAGNSISWSVPTALDMGYVREFMPVLAEKSVFSSDDLIAVTTYRADEPNSAWSNSAPVYLVFRNNEWSILLFDY